MADETQYDDPSEKTQLISEDDPEVTVALGEKGAKGKNVRPDDPSDDHTKTKTLPSYDFSVALHTSSRILNMLMGKKRRNVDVEIESEGKNEGNTTLQWDGNDEDFSDVFSLYEKREDFAGGGQGVLSFAYDRSLHRTVALKSLRKEHLGKKTSREDFIREARMTASLDHPSIVPVYHLGGDGENGLHLAMKSLHGISLKRYLEQVCIHYQTDGVRNFDERESLHHRIDIFLQICDAMEYAHNKKVIHGDLKPENIMIGEFHECYIMDWGTARPAGAEKTADQRIVGTPRYIAPELLQGGPDGIQIDIYSLGVILFELVTLRAAFSGETTSEILAKVKAGAFNPLRHRFHAKIPGDLAAIIRKAVSPDLNHRYHTVGELSEDLRRFLRGEEVSANPDGKIGKVVRWSNHHSGMLLVIILLLFLSSIAAATIGILESVVKTSEKERLLDGAEQYAYAKVRQNVEGMQTLLNHISMELDMLNSDAALLLSLPAIPGASVAPEFCPVEDIREICEKKGNCFSPDADAPEFFTYGMPLYFGGISYLIPSGTDRQKVKEDLAKLSPIVSRLKRTVLDSSPELSDDLSDARRIDAYKKGELPILYAYFSLAKNGLHLNYPGKPDYSEGYDPRQRPWYRNALGKGGKLIWSAPYHATGAMRTLMITASMELLDGNKKSHGVAGVDLPLTIFTKFMTLNPEAGYYTVSRMLIDEQGRIILQADGDGRTMDLHPLTEGVNGVAESPQFPDAKLLKNIRHRGYGSMLVKENESPILYVFSSIPALRWSYVEKLKWDKLLNYPLLSY